MSIPNLMPHRIHHVSCGSRFPLHFCRDPQHFSELPQMELAIIKVRRIDNMGSFKVLTGLLISRIILVSLKLTSLYSYSLNLCYKLRVRHYTICNDEEAQHPYPHNTIYKSMEWHQHDNL